MTMTLPCSSRFMTSDRQETCGHLLQRCLRNSAPRSQLHGGRGFRCEVRRRPHGQGERAASVSGISKVVSGFRIFADYLTLTQLLGLRIATAVACSTAASFSDHLLGVCWCCLRFFVIAGITIVISLSWCMQLCLVLPCSIVAADTGSAVIGTTSRCGHHWHGY